MEDMKIRNFNYQHFIIQENPLSKKTKNKMTELTLIF